MTQTLILNGILNIIAFIYPQASPIIKIIERMLPYIVAAEPFVASAIKSGSGVLIEVEKSFPELYKEIVFLSEQINEKFKLSATKTNVSAENTARFLFGFHKMTAAEERKWMNGYDATPGGA